jgi:hypothetical protein
MTTEDDLLVHFHGGGRLFLLLWWTEDDGNHVVLARSEVALHEVAACVFEKHPDARIKEACEIDVTGPPPRLQRLHAIASKASRVTEFHNEVISYLLDVVSSRHSLPKPFSLCALYEPCNTELEITQEGWAVSMHYECRNCYRGISMGTMSPEELYARYHAAWRVEHPVVLRDGGKRKSEAPPASDDAPLWHAWADFGDHSSGVVLSEVDVKADIDDDRPYLPEDVLFFFRRVADLDVGSMRAALSECVAAEKARMEADSQAVAENRIRSVRARVDDVIAFFRKVR